MREISAARSIDCDIKTDEISRFYGKAWYDFLGRCRTALGTESGSNIFDFDGSLRPKYNELELKKGSAPTYEEFRHYADPRENDIEMGQISPRAFEALATGTPMVLISGRYSGIMESGKHYIELRKDFSNVDHVLDQIDNIDGLNALADRAYDHLVASDYDYHRFVATIDDAIGRKREELAATQSLCVPQAVPLPVCQTLLASSPTVMEEPTPVPRDVIFYQYRQLSAENDALKHDLNCLRSRFADEPVDLTANSALKDRNLSMRQGVSPASLVMCNLNLSGRPVHLSARWTTPSQGP